MKRSKAKVSQPGIRELASEQSEKLRAFCHYLLPSEIPADEFLLEVFRDFAEIHRASNLSAEIQPQLLRQRLYQLCWSRIRAVIVKTPLLSVDGRDTRDLRDLDSDMLEHWRKSGSGNARESLTTRVAARLKRVDPDLRAVILLRDVLGMDDESVAAILGVRWGVYRHRLHRGRMEFLDHLKGKGPSYPSEKARPREESQW